MIAYEITYLDKLDDANSKVGAHDPVATTNRANEAKIKGTDSEVWTKAMRYIPTSIQEKSVAKWQKVKIQKSKPTRILTFSSRGGEQFEYPLLGCLAVAKEISMLYSPA
jgi:hypothetical protein